MAPRIRNVRKNNNGGAQSGRSLARMVNARLKVDVDGRRFTPQRSPPEITQTPWNSIVLTIKQTSSTTTTTATSINAAQAYIALRAQIAGTLLPDTAVGEMRFTMFEAWNMGNTASVSANVYPLISLAVAQEARMIRLEDNPGKNTWACVGYEWPRSHRNYVIPSGIQVPIVDVFSDVASSVIWIRLHMLWRFRVNAPPDYTFGGIFDPDGGEDDDTSAVLV